MNVPQMNNLPQAKVVTAVELERHNSGHVPVAQQVGGGGMGMSVAVAVPADRASERFVMPPVVGPVVNAAPAYTNNQLGELQQHGLQLEHVAMAFRKKFIVNLSTFYLVWPQVMQHMAEPMYVRLVPSCGGLGVGEA